MAGNRKGKGTDFITIICVMVILVILLCLMVGYLNKLKSMEKSTENDTSSKETMKVIGEEENETENIVNNTIDNKVTNNTIKNDNNVMNTTTNEVITNEIEDTNTIALNETDTSASNTVIEEAIFDENVNFTNEEVKVAFQRYLTLIGALSSNQERFLIQLGIIDESNDYSIKTEDNFVRTDVSYFDFKNTILNYVTEDWFKDENGLNGDFYFKNIDGYLYYRDGGATGLNFEVDSVELKGDYSNISYIGKVYNTTFIENDSEKILQDVEFHISSYYGKCVISYCDSI